MEILNTDCSIWVFHYKVIVLLESIDLKSMCNALECFLKFEHFTDCFIREYWSILDELSSVFWNIYLLC